MRLVIKVLAAVASVAIVHRWLNGVGDESTPEWDDRYFVDPDEMVGPNGHSPGTPYSFGQPT